MKRKPKPDAALLKAREMMRLALAVALLGAGFGMGWPEVAEHVTSTKAPLTRSSL